MTVDGRLFAYLRTRLAGDSTIAAANAAIVRDDWVASQVNQGPPRIQYNPFRYRRGSLDRGEFGLTIVCERPNAFGTESGDTAGTLETLALATVARLAGQRATGITGFAVSTFDFRGARRTTLDDPTLVTLRLDYEMSAIQGGSAVPLTGDDGDLSSAGIEGVVLGWQIRVVAPMDFGRTPRSRTTMQPTTGDPYATGTIDVQPTATDTPFPTIGHNATIPVTFQTESGVSWAEDVMVTEIGREVNKETGSQFMRIAFVINNDNSPVYGGAVP